MRASGTLLTLLMLSMGACKDGETPQAAGGSLATGDPSGGTISVGGAPGTDGNDATDAGTLALEEEEDAGGLAAVEAGSDAQADASVTATVSWSAVLSQPATWYLGAQAALVATHVLYYQNADGGWPKNIDIIGATSPLAKSTIDNSATTSELAFLAKMVTATQDPTYLAAFDLGIDYLLAAQYANGGWPQYYPDPTGYHQQITYNDDAMIHVMTLLRDVGNKRAPDYLFVDDERVAKSATAVVKGIDCLLKTQIVASNGYKTAWCAQHDFETLLPAPARAYELVSNSGKEGAHVLSFLMSIDNPSPAVVYAVQSAVRWFNSVAIQGIRVQSVTVDGAGDVVVVPSPGAPPTWARFYELDTDLPFFCGRDGIKKYSLAEIELERRTGYDWYDDWPRAALTNYSSTWQPKWAPGQNVLTNPDAIGPAMSSTDGGSADAAAD